MIFAMEHKFGRDMKLGEFLTHVVGVIAVAAWANAIYVHTKRSRHVDRLLERYGDLAIAAVAHESMWASTWTTVATGITVLFAVMAAFVHFRLLRDS